MSPLRRLGIAEFIHHAIQDGGSAHRLALIFPKAGALVDQTNPMGIWVNFADSKVQSPLRKSSSFRAGATGLKGPTGHPSATAPGAPNELPLFNASPFVIVFYSDPLVEKTAHPRRTGFDPWMPLGFDSRVRFPRGHACRETSPVAAFHPDSSNLAASALDRRSGNEPSERPGSDRWECTAPGAPNELSFHVATGLKCESYKISWFDKNAHHERTDAVRGPFRGDRKPAAKGADTNELEVQSTPLARVANGSGHDRAAPQAALTLFRPVNTIIRQWRRGVKSARRPGSETR